MNIAEHKLQIFRQIDQLPEESLIELEKIIAQLQANADAMKTVCLTEDFNAPLDEFKPYMQSVWLGIEQWRKQAQFSDGDEELTDEMVASWRDKNSGRDFSWNS
jgi:hypothetical protein